jgi:hypothetical protein
MMADNFVTNAGSGGSTFASDDVGSVHYPRLKAVPGIDGQAGDNGLSIFRSLDLDETEEEIKGSAGAVYGWYITNLASAKRYIKFYNATAANVTVGTTTPVMTLCLDAGQSANVFMPFGIYFSTAISVAATTGLADNDTGAPAANEVVVNVFYV